MPKPRVAVQNLGCRVNRVESDRIVRDLASFGCEIVAPDEASVIVINTCAVTGEAEAKTRKAVRHALAFPQEPFVIATGCSVNLHADMLNELGPRVVCEPSKVEVAKRVREVLGPVNLNRNDLKPTDIVSILGRTRLGIKIQDGCNNRCTYCIVWKARGPERSIPPERIIEQVRQAVRADIPEVVLTGVNLGAYDGVSATDEHVEIDELILRILNETGIKHVRLGSVEPMDLSSRLVPVMSENKHRVAPFLHLPVQSLSSAVLARMERRYTFEEFERSVREVRAKLPEVALSCDIIVGFPGESDAEFAETLERAGQIGFSRMHVFRYSARPGTPAAEMPNQIESEVMAKRSSAMRKLAREMAIRDARGRIGSIEKAVIEDGAQATLASYHRAVIENIEDLGDKRICDVAIIDVDASGLVRARALVD